MVGGSVYRDVKVGIRGEGALFVNDVGWREQYQTGARRENFVAGRHFDASFAVKHHFPAGVLVRRKVVAARRAITSRMAENQALHAYQLSDFWRQVQKIWRVCLGFWH